MKSYFEAIFLINIIIS